MANKFRITIEFSFVKEDGTEFDESVARQIAEEARFNVTRRLEAGGFMPEEGDAELDYLLISLGKV